MRRTGQTKARRGPPTPSFKTSPGELRNRAKANLSALIESTEDPIWSVDREDRLTVFNRAVQQHVESMFGVRLAPGMRPSDIAPPERAGLMPALYKRARSEGAFRVEFPLAGGRTLDLALSPILVDGNVTGVSVFGKDITERKRAEELLRESLAALDEAQMAGALGFYLLDCPAGQWTGSAVLDEIFGIGKDYDHSVEGWLALVHPLDRDLMAAYFQDEVVGAGKPFDKEYRIVRRRDGAERWVHGLGRLECDAQGHPLRMRGVIKDITARKLVELQLRDSEERYRTVFETCPDAILISRIGDGAILDVNRPFLESAGFERGEVIGHTALELGIWVHESDRLGFADTMLSSSTVRDMEVMSRRKSGEVFWNRLSASSIEIGGERCRVTFAKEVSEVKTAEKHLAAVQEALQASETRYRTAFQTSMDAIAISSLGDGRYIDVNKAFLDLLGHEHGEVVGRTSAEIGLWAYPETRDEMVRLLLQYSGFRDMKTQFVRKTGELLWVIVSASVVEIDGDSCILSVIRDISGVKQAEDKIWNLVFCDPLTGLPNRSLLLDRLRRTPAASFRNGRKRALLFVDLDNFKTLNDAIGHQAGDLLLQEVARRLTECVRETDTVARLGGDEFLLMLENLSENLEDAAAQAKIVAEKILAIVAQPCVLDGRECLCPASIGITVFGDETESAHEALQRAEIAMFQAKEAGRNTLCFFSPGLQTAINDRAAMHEDLRRALRENEFSLFYQPQLEGTYLIGAEALIRWNHPKQGLVLPGKFIPVAEETGLILPLGTWVLEAACEQIAAWARRPEIAHIAVAVNISARQFRQPEFVNQVLNALDRTGANPRNLRLELTESMLVDNIEDVVSKMNTLKLLGLRFSLDDFGIGYSSLSYLKLLPLDQLKIDRSFVRDMLVDATSGAIAQTIVSLGRAMGLTVIAEGVETDEQRDFLVGLGCHSFQGFLFSRPLPVEEFERRWQARMHAAAAILK